MRISSKKVDGGGMELHVEDGLGNRLTAVYGKDLALINKIEVGDMIEIGEQVADQIVRMNRKNECAKKNGSTVPESVVMNYFEMLSVVDALSELEWEVLMVQAAARLN
jgi:hypothetical protein